MLHRENIPLIIMAAVSAAILVFFAFSEGVVRAAQQQHGNCGLSRQAGIATVWPYLETTPKGSWNPAFPVSPPSRRPDQVGCMR
jgi:hypothetical protein